MAIVKLLSFKGNVGNIIKGNCFQCKILHLQNRVLLFIGKLNMAVSRLS
jgi:hypothetical protein